MFGFFLSPAIEGKFHRFNSTGATMVRKFEIIEVAASFFDATGVMRTQ